MDWSDIRANWPAHARRLAQRWPVLDEAELLALDGDREAVIDYLAAATGMERLAAGGELADWQMGETPLDVLMDARQDNRNIAQSGRHVPEGETPLDDDAAFGDEATPERLVGRR